MNGTCFGEGFGRSPQFLFVATANDDHSARLKEGSSNSISDAAPPTGYQGDLTRQWRPRKHAI
jgi:hypothetical protein